jgi:hypothetical protein
VVLIQLDFWDTYVQLEKNGKGIIQSGDSKG